jgi:hypothetical protein
MRFGPFQWKRGEAGAGRPVQIREFVQHDIHTALESWRGPAKTGVKFGILPAL